MPYFITTQKSQLDRKRGVFDAQDDDLIPRLGKNPLEQQL